MIFWEWFCFPFLGGYFWGMNNMNYWICGNEMLECHRKHCFWTIKQISGNENSCKLKIKERTWQKIIPPVIFFRFWPLLAAPYFFQDAYCVLLNMVWTPLATLFTVRTVANRPKCRVHNCLIGSQVCFCFWQSNWQDNYFKVFASLFFYFSRPLPSGALTSRDRWT